MQDYRRLRVWEKAYRLALELYRRSDVFPRHELFGITSQLRRASFSLPLNIAEACGRVSPADQQRFITIALGSVNELECLLLFVSDLDYIGREECTASLRTVVEIRCMLVALSKRMGAPRPCNRKLATGNRKPPMASAPPSAPPPPPSRGTPS